MGKRVGCSSAGQTWRVGKNYRDQEYCLQCWHADFTQRSERFGLPRCSFNRGGPGSRREHGGLRGGCDELCSPPPKKKLCVKGYILV